MTRVTPMPCSPGSLLKQPKEDKPKARKGMPRKSAKRIAQEQSPEGKFDANYMAGVGKLACAVCTKYGMMQLSRTQVHHPIHGRFSTRRSKHTDCIPLCEGHHQGLFDTSKVALHQVPSKWKRLYGEDTSYIKETQATIARMFGIEVEDRPNARRD